MKNKPHINPEEDWKDLAPTLFSMKKENPFSVPDNYFESLSTNIIDACLAEQKKAPFYLRLLGFKEKVSITQLVSSPRIWIGIAACLLIAFIGIRRFENGEPLQQDPASIGFQEMCASPVMESIDEETLTDALAEQGYFDAVESEENSKVSDKDMQDYLIKNNIDVTLISREL